MSCRFQYIHTCYRFFISQKRHLPQQLQQRSLWNNTRFWTSPPPVSFTSRTTPPHWDQQCYYIATTSIIIIVSSSLATMNIMYQQYDINKEVDDRIQNVPDDETSSYCPVVYPTLDDSKDKTASSSSLSSTIIMATSSWRSSSQEMLDHSNITKPLQQQLPEEGEQKSNLHAPTGSWRIIHPNPYIEICYDTRTRNPIYVQYKLLVPHHHHQEQRHITSSSSKEHETNHATTTTIMKQKRPNYHFYEDTSIEERYRSRNSYYHNSGYDRGHLAPAADFPNNNNNNNTNDANNYHYDIMKTTYNLCNISPQYPELNRIVWNQLEQFIRSIAYQYNNTYNGAVTYVTTGPIYLPSKQINDKLYQYTINGIGKPPSLIMVPTHFFKVVVVLDPTETNILYFACFVLPNDPNIIESSSSSKTRSLENFIVPWTDLEAVTGLNFYPDLVDENWKVYSDHITRSIIQQQPPESNQKPLLLLTDGNRNNNNGTMTTFASKQQQPKLNIELQHLCANQACVPRKQQKS